MSNKIVYNGVTYNKDELPDDVRNKLKMHESIDWKETARRQRREKWKKSSLAHKIASSVFLSLLAVILPLVFYSFFTSVSTTVDILGTFGVIYLCVIFFLIASCTYLFVNNSNASPSFGNTLPQRILTISVGLFGVSILVAGAIFTGLPAVMHHLTKSQGTIELTVSSKSDRYSRYHCSPSLSMQEFAWHLTKPICPSREKYESIAVGDMVDVSGLISPFGVEAEYLTVNR